MNPQSRNEALLRAMIDGTGKGDLEPAQSRIEALLYELMDKIDQGGGGGGGAEIVPKFSYDETTQTHSCDMSFDDVADAISAGRCHWAVSDQEGWLQIKSYDPEDLSWGITFGPSISFVWGGTSYRWINRVTLTLNQDESVEKTSEQIDTRPGT